MLNKRSNKKKNMPSNRKGFFQKRTCFFTREKITYIDYKNVDLLKKFISKSGQILPRIVTGTKCKYQKHLAKAIKRARFLGFLSFVTHPDNVE